MRRPVVTVKGTLLGFARRMALALAMAAGIWIVIWIVEALYAVSRQPLP